MPAANGNWMSPPYRRCLRPNQRDRTGCEAALKYRKKMEASISNEYAFDTTSKSGNFYYSWPQVTLRRSNGFAWVL